MPLPSEMQMADDQFSATHMLKNISEEIGINTRLQWIPKAGQEGFIVLNYGLEDRDRNNSFRAASSDLSLKFRYTLRF